jgi:hypothetical protein
VSDLTELERESLQSFIRDGGLVKSGLAKFLNAQSISSESNCAGAVRANPEQFKLATEYAAKADVYRSFLADLERFSER